MAFTGHEESKLMNPLRHPANQTNGYVDSDEEYITEPLVRIENDAIPVNPPQNILEHPTNQPEANYNQIGSHAENVFNPELGIESSIFSAEFANEVDVKRQNSWEYNHGEPGKNNCYV